MREEALVQDAAGQRTRTRPSRACAGASSAKARCARATSSAAPTARRPAGGTGRPRRPRSSISGRRAGSRSRAATASTSSTTWSSACCPTRTPRRRRRTTSSSSGRAARRSSGSARRPPAELAHFWDAVSSRDAAALVPRGGVATAARCRCGSAPPNGAQPRPRASRCPTGRRARGARPSRAPSCACSRRSIPWCATASGSQRLFAFDYRFEAFTPAAKRRYGYYVLPILERDRFVGRFDPRHDRARERLVVDGVWWEPGVRPTAARKRALGRALEKLAARIGARRSSSTGRGLASHQRALVRGEAAALVERPRARVHVVDLEVQRADAELADTARPRARARASPMPGRAGARARTARRRTRRGRGARGCSPGEHVVADRRDSSSIATTRPNSGFARMPGERAAHRGLDERQPLDHPELAHDRKQRLEVAPARRPGTGRRRRVAFGLLTVA